jgi:hypothetical protein
MADCSEIHPVPRIGILIFVRYGTFPQDNAPVPEFIGHLAHGAGHVHDAQVGHEPGVEKGINTMAAAQAVQLPAIQEEIFFRQGADRFSNIEYFPVGDPDRGRVIRTVFIVPLFFRGAGADAFFELDSGGRVLQFRVFQDFFILGYLSA